IDSSDFDNEQITVVGTDKLKNGAKTLPLYPIDFDICELGSSAPRVIGQSNCVIKIDDFIAYGRKKLETAGADDIMILEPLYIQKFPARAK
ncbi:MAG: hypothetical protein NTV06_01030, partial [candidate division Zixibacteria bacterium]|nr:hypothetical protein [candidate division Zixibacteria bacterium]